MSYFVSTAMGFITSAEYSPDNPKRCIHQTNGRDVRWAYPFRTWDEANRFAMLITTSPFWPNSKRYFAVLSPMSPNAKMMPKEQPVRRQPAPKKAGLGDRFRAFMAS